MAKEESGELILPSETEIAELPRMARVAFAARCARRVQPLYKHFWPDAPQKHLDSIDRAITLAQSSAVCPDSASDADARAANAARAADAVNAAYAARAANLYNANTATVNATARAASYAATTAAADDAINATRAARTAYAAAEAASLAAAAAATAAIRRDFESLRMAADHENWTDDTPVPPEFFGPLWPDGEPESWPENGREPRAHDVELVLEIEIPEDATDEEVIRLIERVADETDDVHRAYDGDGLRIKRVEMEMPSPVPQEVTS